MQRFLALCFAFFLIVVAVGCDAGGDEPRVLIEDLVIGRGAEAYEGSWVVVRQKGWTQDGQVFWSTWEAGRPDTLKLKPDEVIEGWMVGVVGMRVGGQRRLTIPPELAYGSEAKKYELDGDSVAIPPGSTLVFDVYLCDVVDEEAPVATCSPLAEH